MQTNKTSLPTVAVLLNDARGIYIPRDFAEGFDNWQGITEEDKACLSDPENEFYWDTWESVLNKAKFEQDGYTWQLYQDGALFAYCFELMTDKEKHNFGFDDY